MPRLGVDIGGTKIEIAVFDDERREALRRLAMVSAKCEGDWPRGVMLAGFDRDQ